MLKNDNPATFFYNVKAALDRIPYKKIRVFYPYLALFNFLLLIYILYNVFLDKNTWAGSEERVIQIHTGYGLNEITEELLNRGAIENGLTFKIAARLTGKDRSIWPRKYVITNGMTNMDILEILTDNEIAQNVRFRIPEGVTIRKLAETVESRLLIPGHEFTKATEDRLLMNTLGLGENVKNLEGFLFPETYIFPVSIDADGLVKIFVNEFKKRVIIENEDIIDTIRQRDQTLLEVVTMASIVEAETAIKEEMPVISGVFYNRIEKNMRLEADPTVQYILPDGPKSRLLFEDLRIDSPYNTYRNRGLPPGPINNPGLDAIKAAVYPEKHNYLFFVVMGGGRHKFSETFEEHKEAAQEYRKKLDEQNK